MIIVLVIVYSTKHVLTGIEKYNLFDLFLYLEKEDLQLHPVKSQSCYHCFRKPDICMIRDTEKRRRPAIWHIRIKRKTFIMGLFIWRTCDKSTVRQWDKLHKQQLWFTVSSYTMLHMMIDVNLINDCNNIHHNAKGPIKNIWFKNPFVDPTGQQWTNITHTVFRWLSCISMYMLASLNTKELFLVPQWNHHLI